MTSRKRRRYAMSNSSSSSSGGIGFTGALAILFIGLKLGGVISWSWLWVLSPLWIPLAIGLVLLLLFGIGAVIAAVLSAIFDQ
jgi:hypothetical protein